MSNVITYGILINRKRECNNKITEKNKSCKKRKEKEKQLFAYQRYHFLSLTTTINVELIHNQLLLLKSAIFLAHIESF